MSSQTPLSELIFNRLADDGVPDRVASLVLAACASEESLHAVATGAEETWQVPESKVTIRHDDVYLSAITVAGFRGIGPQTALLLDPRPSLTLVVGSNGCGKSSFAEALELALTGDSARWADRHTVLLKEGWRNLHSPAPCGIEVTLKVDGTADPIRVGRRWPDPTASLEQAVCTVDQSRRIAETPAELGWKPPLDTYRPFLTAADFGRLLTSRPSELHDVLRCILGLEPLTAGTKRLTALAKRYTDRAKALRDERAGLRAELAANQDERCQQAAAILAGRKLDDAVLARLDEILSISVDESPGSDADCCRRLRRLEPPATDTVRDVVSELRQAATAATDHTGPIAASADRLAQLLQLALAHYRETGDGACPVCESGTLDPRWREVAIARATEAREQAAAARDAAARLAAVRNQARRLVSTVTVPDVAVLDLAELRTAHTAWVSIPTAAEELAAHLEATYPPLLAALQRAQAEADAWLRQRHDAWRQATATLRTWSEQARVALDEEQIASDVKAAQAWLKKATNDLCNDQLAPFAKHSQDIWQQLRQQSSVTLDAIRLSGTGTVTQRKVEFDVSVDGAKGSAALAVMSQGELQALALAVFLPRACAKNSPFRFVVIDDPVQSMDPAKVDGLARVLEEQSRTHQVVVFTHDNRLPEAIRRLDIEATIWEVRRQAGSVVTIERSIDPVIRHLDDAWAMAKTDDLDERVRRPVVAGLCRSAIEARCQDLVRRVRIGRGEPYAQVERLLDGKGPMPLLALALFDDAERGSEVLGRLRRKGAWAASVVQAAKEGTHDHYRGDLTGMVSDTRRLMREVLA